MKMQRFIMVDGLRLIGGSFTMVGNGRCEMHDVQVEDGKLWEGNASENGMRLGQGAVVVEG